MLPLHQASTMHGVGIEPTLSETPRLQRGAVPLLRPMLKCSWGESNSHGLMYSPNSFSSYRVLPITPQLRSTSLTGLEPVLRS